MAEDTGQPDADQNDDTQPNDDDSDTLGEPGKRALDAERQARKTAERQLADLQRRLKEHEDRGKSELERLTERATEAEKQAAQAEASYLRMKVGTAKGLAPELAARLQGSTEEEMAADADRLAEVLGNSAKPPADAFDARRGGGTPDKPGDMDSLISQLGRRR